MDILSLLITLAVFGVVVYLITLIPMNGTIKQVIIVVAVLFIVLWLLQTLGVFHMGSLGTLRTQ
jgi:hypothetical protein